jgi:hypothetical protein
MYKTYPVPSELKQILLQNKPVQTVHKLFKQNNFKIRLAGGYVRDAGILQIPANDIDFATDATPDEMHAIFKKEEIRTFNVNGEVHGTVSCLIEGETLEITTLRSDVETDGRKAVVEFHRDWARDAERRDLTIGQLFLDLDDFLIIDHFDGVEHLKKNIVKFVGDADKRIREDYLRILRYFRFLARMTPAEKPIYRDFETLMKIKNNKEGLVQISRERIWTEMKKICIHKAHGDSVINMIVKDSELSDVISLNSLKPDNFDLYCENFGKIYDLQRKLLIGESSFFGRLNKKYENDEPTFRNQYMILNSYRPSSSIVFLCGLEKVADVMAACKSLKMSNADRDDAVVVMQYKSDVNEAFAQVKIGGPSLEQQLKRILFKNQKAVVNLKQRILFTILVEKALNERSVADAYLFFEQNVDLLEEIFYKWEVPRIPVSGHDIREAVSYAAKNPKSVSMFVRICEKAFMDADLDMGREELLQLCRDNVTEEMMNEVPVGKNKNKKPKKK